MTVLGGKYFLGMGITSTVSAAHSVLPSYMSFEKLSFSIIRVALTTEH